MNEICDDNRFEIIENAKQRLVEATNIEMCPEEMAVLGRADKLCKQAANGA